jgi:polyisoprenoid-binding protein YceI
MLKYVLTAGFLFLIYELHAQVLTFHHGSVEFYTASTLSDIEAITENATVNVNTETGKVDVIIDIKSFEFEYDLMQEHFNEKYMESDKFPRATFNGNIAKDIAGVSNETEFVVAGELNIHGVTKNIVLKVYVSKQDEFTVVKARLPVVFKDYNVEDPTILTKSVAKDVEINCLFYLR